MFFVKNGKAGGGSVSGDRFGQTMTIPQSGAQTTRSVTSCPIYMDSGDYIEVQSVHDTGFNLNLQGNSTVECALQVAQLSNGSFG